MAIKAVIFDLDNTLHDTEYLTEKVLSQTIISMIDKGLKCTLGEGIDRLKEIIKRNPGDGKFRELVRFFGQKDEEIIQAGLDTYSNPEFDNLKIYPEVKEVLEKLKDKYKLVLISQGSPSSQNKRIDTLDIREYFDLIFLPQLEFKKGAFNDTSKALDIYPSEILVVGDRIDSELRIGKELGMKTCRLLKGKYAVLKPKNENEKPDFEISNLEGLYGILDLNQNKKKLKIVAIGGGTGLPTIIEGLRKYTDDLTMIVTVTDSGRSSGILRKELDVLPPGDIRNCLISLTNSDKLMSDLFQYRFDNGSLNGHNFGNLFIAALTKLTGSFEQAISETAKILKLKGKVLPSTFDNVHVCAELEDGTIIEEENNIIDRHNNYVHLRSKIKRIFLKPSAKASEKSLKEIEGADLIVLCPGSLYTSVITNLLVEGITNSINKSKAKKVYVCNIMTQVSQTHEYKASDHVKNILGYLNGILDFVILNNEKPNKDLLDSYKLENAYLVENDIDEVEKLGVKIINEDFLDNVNDKKLLWEKKYLLRHNPDKIAKVLVGLMDINL